MNSAKTFEGLIGMHSSSDKILMAFVLQDPRLVWHSVSKFPLNVYNFPDLGGTLLERKTLSKFEVFCCVY